MQSKISEIDHVRARLQQAKVDAFSEHNRSQHQNSKPTAEQHWYRLKFTFNAPSRKHNASFY